MVALLFNVNTKLSISFFDKLNENSRQQAFFMQMGGSLFSFNV